MTPHRPKVDRKQIALAAAALAVVAAFILLNRSAYDGFFTDDELDNLSWAPGYPLVYFLKTLVSPFFDISNFRPVGHVYFKIMGRLFGLDFAPYMTPIFGFHLLNGSLLYAILRRMKVGAWQSLAGATFFLLSAGAFDAYWKPMYVFDLFCTTFCLLSVLLYAHGRTVLAFIAYWLAYRSKELAVMLPAVLVLYEYWFGERRFLKLVPFLLASLSFGVQGILLNPNRGRNNDYTFHFSLNALKATVPFYARRILLFPFSGIGMFALALTRDRRVWFGLAGMAILVTTLLFLPGRQFIAYAYLPIAFATIAIASALANVRPAWIWVALALWMPWNYRELRHEKRAKLDADDQAYTFVSRIIGWGVRHPEVETLVYDGVPVNFHHWGTTAAWNMAHHAGPFRDQRFGPHAFFHDWPEGAAAMKSQTVAYAHWDGSHITIKTHSPGDPIR